VSTVILIRFILTGSATSTSRSWINRKPKWW